MDAILLGYTLPEVEAAQIFAVDSSPGVHSHKFSVGLARSLRSTYASVHLLSLRPIQNFPLGRRLLFGPGRFVFEGMTGSYAPFINVIILKHLSRLISCLILGFLIGKKLKWSADVFIHGTHTPLLVVGKMLQRAGMRVAVVVTDKPGVELPTDTWLSRQLKKIDQRLVSYLLRGIDGLAGLSPEILARYGAGKKTALFEGIIDEALQKFERPHDLPLHEFVVGYAGGLTAAYGVDRLLAAAVRTPFLPVHLRFFGRGDQVRDIVSAASGNHRLSYGGFVTGGELFGQLVRCDVLINPRPTDADFSVMSFPSKLVEYMGLGRPVLTTKVAGLPEDYLEFLYIIDDESVDGIRSAITRLMECPRSELERRANLGRKFIFDRLGYGRIGSLLSSLVR